MKVLIFGASGKIGHKIYETLAKDEKFIVAGTVRKINTFPKPTSSINSKILKLSDVKNLNKVKDLVASFQPGVIINAVGIVKQHPESNDLNHSFKINSLWPHQLVGIARAVDAYVIQISSDCIFSGLKGRYKEENIPDPIDIYGKSKWMGELYEPKTLTIRTSTIGHEIKTKNGLIEWFLSQAKSINGFSQAIFSGLPTVELASIFQKTILPNINTLSGIYHIGAKPISKHDLLIKVANRYNKKINIIKSIKPKINRSLNSNRFANKTGYQCSNWDALIKKMYLDYQKSNYYQKNVV